jgi:hypothetical protein
VASANRKILFIRRIGKDIVSTGDSEFEYCKAMFKSHCGEK